MRLTGCGRLTIFPLEGLTVAYTTQSGDARGLGDIAIVAVTGPDTVTGPDSATGQGTATGDQLWRLAASMYAQVPSGQTQARWILTQCARARMVRAAAYRELADAPWSADLDREFRLDDLFANHTVLRTGSLALVPGRWNTPPGCH
ncbi:hypothetical protein ACWF94_28090 [Streptomyces sp. NPDC055078]